MENNEFKQDYDNSVADTLPEKLPVLPLKDVVIFPNTVFPLAIGRDSSIKAVEKALNSNRMILCVTQISSSIEDPEQEDLYKVGTAGHILRMLKQSDGKLKILVQGLQRVNVHNIIKVSEGILEGEITPLVINSKEDELATVALMRSVKEQLLKLISMGRHVLPEFVEMLESITESDRLADVLCSNLGLPTQESQNLLELTDPYERLTKISEYLNRELSIMEVQQKIVSTTKGEIDKVQREYFLKEQLKAIQKELGIDGYSSDDNLELEEKIIAAKMPKEIEKEALKQLKRLSSLSPEGAEAGVIRTYLDIMVDLPWSKSSKDNLNLIKAKAILDEDHYGMEDVKERILEFLAINKLNKKLKSPIICLVGPPGVGKTSLGKSIAKALNRSFVRMSFGGIRDEAEIRGHRRTYVGAMPGKIIDAMKNAKTNNPVLMLDEIDKMGANFRGDPASALLEVLDPVQNNSFTDLYLNVPFDLSKVMFITTANYLDPIPAPLKDRMEIIRLSGYTDDEKIAIADKYIIPRQIEENGLKNYDISFSRESIREIIEGYTRESGLRNLEQKISSVCRKIARKIVEKDIESYNVTAKNVRSFLGARKIFNEDELKGNSVGVVTGLAWTPVGGDVLFVECVKYHGKGVLKQTGMMGDVMRESMQAAYTYVRSIASKYNIPEEQFTTYDLHIHIPAGAIPKDGPSAGITMATAIFSTLSGKAVRKDIAMTGEITITGKVLPIGGLKEKLYAAKRQGIKKVFIPLKNKPELDDMPKTIIKSLEIIPITTFDEIIDIAIVD